MPIYHTMGQIPRKRHIAFRKPDGGIYAEELMGHEGFTGTSSLLYHTYPPTTVKSARRLRELKFEADADQTLRHRHFRTSKIKTGGSPTLDRTPQEVGLMQRGKIAGVVRIEDQVLRRAFKGDLIKQGSALMR